MLILVLFVRKQNKLIYGCPIIIVTSGWNLKSSTDVVYEDMWCTLRAFDTSFACLNYFGCFSSSFPFVLSKLSKYFTVVIRTLPLGVSPSLFVGTLKRPGASCKPSNSRNCNNKEFKKTQLQSKSLAKTVLHIWGHTFEGPLKTPVNFFRRIYKTIAEIWPVSMVWGSFLQFAFQLYFTNISFTQYSICARNIPISLTSELRPLKVYMRKRNTKNDKNAGTSHLYLSLSVALYHDCQPEDFGAELIYTVNWISDFNLTLTQSRVHQVRREGNEIIWDRSISSTQLCPHPLLKSISYIHLKMF